MHYSLFRKIDQGIFLRLRSVKPRPFETYRDHLPTICLVVGTCECRVDTCLIILTFPRIFESESWSLTLTLALISSLSSTLICWKHSKWILAKNLIYSNRFKHVISPSMRRNGFLQDREQIRKVLIVQGHPCWRFPWKP